MTSEILKRCMKKGFLLDKEMLDLLNTLNKEIADEIINKMGSFKINERVITKSFFEKNFRTYSFSAGKIITQKSNNAEPDLINPENSDFNKEEKYGKVKLITSPVILPKKVSVQDFINHFRSRFELIRGILEEKNLENLISIRKISNKRDNYTLIGAVVEKRITKNKNIIIEVEDLTGKISILVNQNKKEVFEKAKNLLSDDIAAFSTQGSSEILFANDIIFPDTALNEKKFFNTEEWAAFTSDLHIGSTMFLEKNVLRFLKWINGEEGDEKQKQIAKKIKYLFLVGDNIDGVGVYPEQEKFLILKDAHEQYKKLAELLKLIRKDVKIIMCPGQHDAVWVGEPQPIVDESWAPDLHKLENLTLVPNPSLVEIDGGFRILMYHGASMHGIINEIEELRLKYGHDYPTKVTREMLKRRHLAPIHGSTDYVPNEKEDPLVIKHIPDIVATGDQHKSEISIYNNILLIASSCWQSITPFEEKVGNHPDPCKVPVFNLKTREIKILDFSDRPEELQIDAESSDAGTAEEKRKEGGAK